MKTDVIYHVFGTSMIINIGDKSFTISKDDQRYPIIYDLIKINELETVAIACNQELWANYLKVRERLLTALENYKE